MMTKKKMAVTIIIEVGFFVLFCFFLFLFVVPLSVVPLHCSGIPHIYSLPFSIFYF